MKALNILFGSEELKSSGGEQSSYKTLYWLFILAMRLMDCFQEEFHLLTQLSDFPEEDDPDIKSKQGGILYSHSWAFSGCSHSPIIHITASTTFKAAKGSFLAIYHLLKLFGQHPEKKNQQRETLPFIWSCVHVHLM